MSNVALDYQAGSVPRFVEDHLHRIKLIHNKPAVLKQSKCTRFDVFPANYGFKGGFMSLEKLPILFLLDGSTVIPYKTLAPYAKPIATPIDVAMPVLPPDAYHYQGTKQFLPEAFEGPLVLGCPIVYGHGGTETLSLAEMCLTGLIVMLENIHLETKKAGWSEADLMAEVGTQKVVALELLVNLLSQTGKPTAQFMSKSSVDYEMSELVNALYQTGKHTAQFMGKFSVDYEMVISNQNVLQGAVDNTMGESISIPTISTVILPASQVNSASITPKFLMVIRNQNVLQGAVDNTMGESISIPTISTVILPSSQLKDADQTPRPYENPDDDGADCGCCAIM